MSKTRVASYETSTALSLPPGFSGHAQARSYFPQDDAPLRLHLLEIEQDATLAFEPSAVDRLAHVWQGEVEAGTRRLEAGSTLIVEHGASLDVCALTPQARIAVFSASAPLPNQRSGGHVHLLPRDRVPRVGANDSGTAGGLHANGKCPGCELWLNENTLPPSPPPPPEEANKGVHMHPEDEIIFVTGGDIRLGNRVYEAGAALAVARDTFYGFHPGPSGLSFVTFRPSATNQIRFAAGGDYVHSGFWDAIDQIDYLEPISG